MYISKIQLTNFRNFKNQEISFNDGINVIIGHNNAGKTNLIKAISLVIDSNQSKKLNVDDFNKNIEIQTLKTTPPKISISLTINKGKEETPDDLVVISNWLTKLDNNYEALLTYEFFLPEKKQDAYIKALDSIDNTDPKALDKAWKLIKHEFLRFYMHKLWGGNINNKAVADSESLQKIDFQFLDAIRDVERDMLTGRNTLLREVLDFFMDYDIKINTEKTPDEKYTEIKERRNEFSEKAQVLIDELNKRIKLGKEQILSYAKNTGASFNKASPDFDGTISEDEMYSVLKLIIEYESGIKIPATHNGLGYNNLIFMSLLLAKMQINADVDYLDSNAKIFTTLAIEEPEAHLHPAMQYKFLKFLNENKKDKKVRQIFITTHSTHITSAVSLDEIICLHNENSQTTIGYPSKVFPTLQSQKYVQRFLDATKSDMLFAQKILLVEGIAEQLLLSILADYLDVSLADNHIATINIGGRYFDHFLYLFDSSQENTIHKKVVCITDRDPESKGKANSKYKKCYPFEYNLDTDKYDYKFNIFDQKYEHKKHPNITFFSQNDKGKTFEYDLVLNNPSSNILITDSMSNKEEIQELMTLYKDSSSTVDDLLNVLRDSKENTRIKTSIQANSNYNEDEKKRHIIASRYLNSIGKGENALELAYNLSENLKKKGTDEFIDFIIPPYIQNAITELCQ